MKNFKKIQVLSTIGMFAFYLATLFFVQQAWPLSHQIFNEHSPVLKIKEGDTAHMPPSPLVPDSSKNHKTQDGDRTPPVIDPPVIDPEIAIPPPITDPEMVVKPAPTKPSPDDHTQEETHQESGSDPK